MKKYKHICFDLDGTLMDSYPTILKSTIKTLEMIGVTDQLNETGFRERIGHHFLDIFRELNISVGDVEEFINIYKGNYFNYIDDSILYGGVREIIKSIKEKGLFVSLLTTKGQDQAELILHHFGLDGDFNYIMGRRMEVAIKPSPDPLLMICKELGVLPEETLMVGDSELDIRCAKAAGADSCGVTFGYRSFDQLKGENTDYIIHSYDELREVIEIEIE
jgi:HAD superfamily hydrolase (TIGR01549 family)